MLNLLTTNSRHACEWYALRTKSRHEKVVASSVRGKGYPVLLPLYREERRWSGRDREVELPLFGGYVFAQFDRQVRLPILQTPGVVQIVGTCDGPLPIDDDEIRNIRKVVEIGVRARPWPFVKSGEVVEMTSGPLAGVQGTFVRCKNEHKLILSVELLQRAIAVEVNVNLVRPISSQHTPKHGIISVYNPEVALGSSEPSRSV
jgi:transcriptional antiterminator NusG